METRDLIAQAGPILTEGAILERLKRRGKATLHPLLEHSLLVYDPAGRKALAALHREYMAIAKRHAISMLLFTDTWRASEERLRKAGQEDRDVNGDCVRFLCDLMAREDPEHGIFHLGGLMGCRGDAYRPADALGEDAAAEYHAWQAEALARAGVDFLLGATLPALSEAKGLARAMAGQDVPYGISFMLSPSGTLLDGTPLQDAVREIDSGVRPVPLFYMVNCCHPNALRAGILASRDSGRPLLQRLIGIQANASPLGPEALDGAANPHAVPASDLARDLTQLMREYSVRILGGCCGTDGSHIEALAHRLQRMRA